MQNNCKLASFLAIIQKITPKPLMSNFVMLYSTFTSYNYTGGLERLNKGNVLILEDEKFVLARICVTN